VRRLTEEGYTGLLTRPRSALDLLDGAAVEAFFAEEKPAYVVLAAARVGGILANRDRPADFLWENLTIQNNVLQASLRHRVTKLLFLGSSCIYPKHAPQPLREDALLTGPLEPTNDAYAIAKIAGIKLCDAMNRQHGTDFLSAMPTNLYGPGDNFDLQGSHVLPAMVRKFHLVSRARDPEALLRDEARYGPIPEDVRAMLSGPDPAVLLWGTGSPRREFLYSDDLAAACVHLLEHVHARDLGGEATADRNPCALVNVGYGEDVTIRELAALVSEVVGYQGPLRWDSARPDGTPRKLMDSSRLFALGWRPRVPLREGITRLYQSYLAAL
jgi:GDP-L-fucose synthase